MAASFSKIEMLCNVVGIPERFGTMSQFRLPKELLGGHSEIVERGGHMLSIGLLEEFGTFDKMSVSKDALPFSFWAAWRAR